MSNSLRARISKLGYKGLLSEKDVKRIRDALLNEMKYRWHDLRKNPEDLPEKCGFYIACVEHPTNHTRNTREVQLYNIVNGKCVWRKNNRFLLEKSVIAWREIEEFEVEEE